MLKYLIGSYLKNPGDGAKDYPPGGDGNRPSNVFDGAAAAADDIAMIEAVYRPGGLFSWLSRPECANPVCIPVDVTALTPGVAVCFMVTDGVVYYVVAFESPTVPAL